VIEYFSILSELNPFRKHRQGQTYGFTPIGFVRSPFKDKFGIPRQSALAVAAKGVIKFNDDPDLITALKTIETFSHLWLVFVFHDHGGKNWKPSIRPPRLGGRTKVGVLASRSPHRPNPIGLSPVKIEKVDLHAAGGAEIVVAGLDLLDGTPILDVKPYLPYADAIAEAKAGWAEEIIQTFPLSFSVEAERALLEIAKTHPEFPALLQQILEIDPRPAYQKRDFSISAPESQGLRYGIEIADHEIKYVIEGGGLLVQQIYAATRKNENPKNQ
jgi:tRNA-Thr(GGU) m(6)t(6)A37 methyltransferase TsaA